MAFSKNDAGLTLLHWAIAAGSAETVAALLAKGAGVAEPGAEGGTSPQVIEALLAAGAGGG